MGDWPSHLVGTKLIERCPNCKIYKVAIKPVKALDPTGKLATWWYCCRCGKPVSKEQ